MNILLLQKTDFLDATRCRLDGERARHVRQVLKSSVGDSLRIGLLNDKLGYAKILSLDTECLLLDVTLDSPPPAPLPITLLLALPRPKMLGRLLRDVTSLGVKDIHLFQSDKVEKSYWQTPSLAPAYVENKLHEGLSQARDTLLPNIHYHRRFNTLLHDVLPEILHTHTGVLADPFSPGADIAPCAGDQLLALAIGPEGGFSEIERQQLLTAGCQPLWLGSRILRVETAVHVAIGRLSSKFRLP